MSESLKGGTMSCPLLDQVFTAAGNQPQPLPLQIELGVLQGGIIIAGSMPTVSGSGQLLYTPFHRLNFPNSPFHFIAPPIFSGVIHCTASWQTPQGAQSSPQDVTVQIASPFLFAGKYSVSLSTSAEAAIPIIGSFEPTCSYIFGENHGSLTGLLGETPVKINLIVHPKPL
jgi:hypothetical protein